jgi:hypothetical protein
VIQSNTSRRDVKKKSLKDFNIGRICADLFGKYGTYFTLAPLKDLAKSMFQIHQLVLQQS